jgi:hypothetical protein
MKISKKDLSSNEIIEVNVTWEGKITNVKSYSTISNIEPDEYDILNHGIYIPIPFNSGDIIESCLDDCIPRFYVIQNIKLADLTDYHKNIISKTSYIYHIKLLGEEKGVIWNYDHDGISNNPYLYWRYCKSTLEGAKKILKYLSLYLKGHLEINALLEAQKMLTLRMLVNEKHDSYGRYEFLTVDNDMFKENTNIINEIVYSKSNAVLLTASKEIIGTYIVPEGVEEIDSYAFNGCTKLIGIEMSNTLERIGESAFYGCASLKSITLPDTILSIDSHAFEGCITLSSINIPSGVYNLSSTSFNHCEALMSINISKSNCYYTDIDGVMFNKSLTILLKYPEGKNLKSYVIPEGITKISKNAFLCVNTLESVTIPSSLCVLEQDTFKCCEVLTSVIIRDGLEEIHNYAFNSCKSLCDVIIPDSVKVIEYNSFDDCPSLSEITKQRIQKVINNNKRST